MSSNKSSVSYVQKNNRLKNMSEVDTSTCHIHQLSVEIITYIFAQLDPASLATVAGVCSYWRHIIMDDSCWKDAFISYFGCLPFKRISSESWKTEYILRMHLLSKWAKGRSPVISLNPEIAPIKSLHNDFNESALTVASTQYGIAVKFHMTSGKRDRHLIYSNREKVRQRVSSVVMDGERVLWGHESGSITLCIRKKSNGNPHNKFKVFSGFHLGPVTLLSFPKLVSDVVVSGGVDRTIKIWDITTTLSVWTLLGPALPTSLEVTPDHRIIVGCEDGTISVWNDINLGQLAQFHRDNSSSSNYDILKRRLSSEIESKKLIIPPFNESDRHQVKSMIYDTQKCVIIVTYTGSTMIKKYAVESGQCLATYVLGHAHANEITSIKWDISPVNTIGSLESILKFRRTQNKRGNIIDLTLGKTADSDSSTGHALSKATRLLVSGDDFGRICVWNGDHDGITKPIRILDGHAASISALFVDKFKIVSGSDDGWIHVWEPLSGRNILTFSNKIPKNAPINRDDVNMTRVTNIDCSEYQGVVTIGNMIKIWDFSPGKEFTSKSKNKGKPAMNSRDRYKSVIHREVEESIKKIRAERIEEIQNDEAIKKMSLGGLSDEEMLEYALMLSTDHEDSYPSSDPFDSADYIEDSDDELMKAVIASLELEVHDPTVNFE